MTSVMSIPPLLICSAYSDLSMTLRMADGPVANLPPGLDAYAGYVDNSGIGITWPEVQQIPAANHLSISVWGNPAMCADIEAGAMSSWAGYDYGYCSVSAVNSLIARFGRPRKLWTAHYDPSFGAHICSPICWPGLVTTADGTQWTDHGSWDESLLADDFFGTPTPPTPPPVKGTTDVSSRFKRLTDGTAIAVEITPIGQVWVKNAAPNTFLQTAKNQEIPGVSAIPGTLDMELTAGGTGAEGVWQNAPDGAMTYFEINGTLNLDGTVVVGRNNVP